MTDDFDRSLATQVLTGIIEAPHRTAAAALRALEKDDFPDWRDSTIFLALRSVTFAEHPARESILTQVNSYLLESGHFKDQDNGLRAAVIHLTQITGHPEQLPHFMQSLREQRFREAVMDFALGIAQHAKDSPIADIQTALNNLGELGRLAQRINIQPQRHLAISSEGGAA